MKEVTIVTGPMRSGTSCITGLLELCGMDLGRNIRILRNKTEVNPGGHFEPDLLFTINSRLIQETPGGLWSAFHAPDESTMLQLADKRKKYFNLFIKKFDGNLCKEPQLCLTLSFWRKYWPDLTRAIFCLRHPLSVARSMRKRYGLPIGICLNVWYTYTSRFISGSKKYQVFILDFDVFVKNPLDELLKILKWIGQPVLKTDMEKQISDFFSTKYVNWVFKDSDLDRIPPHIKELYTKVKSCAGADKIKDLSSKYF